MPEQGLIEDVIQLRAIIHGLKMAGLSFVDQEALTSIQQRIKNLPSPEMLTALSGKKEEIKNVAKEVGEIIQLIEIYGKRNEESKQRSISTKGLPPRYKILEWRQAMSNKNVLVRDFVNISSELDKKGLSSLAAKSIVCAKRIKEEVATQPEIEALINEINASGNEDLTKEAQAKKPWFFQRDPASNVVREKQKQEKQNVKQQKSDFNTAAKSLQSIIDAPQNTAKQAYINVIKTLPPEVQKAFGVEQLEQALAAVNEAFGNVKSVAQAQLKSLQDQYYAQVSGQPQQQAPAAPASGAATPPPLPPPLPASSGDGQAELNALFAKYPDLAAKYATK